MLSELEEAKVTAKTAYDLTARCAVLDKEISNLKKQVKDLVASSKKKVQDTIDSAKRSAVTSILQAKIQMAKEAGDKGIELWKEELESWNAVLEKIKKEKTATSVGFEAQAKGEEDTGTSKEAGNGQEEEVVVAAFVGDEGC